jgi:hypothetical protein
MTLITIFSAPKPFTDPHIDVIQRNAIQSWIRLGVDVEVILVGEEDGMADVAAEYGVRMLTQVERNASGTPLVSSIFDLVRQASHSPFLAYVNADILLLPDLVQATCQAGNALQGDHNDEFSSGGDEAFLLIGQRWDLEVTAPLEYSASWQERLKDQVQTQGQLHAPAGSDYFVFPRTAFTHMPDFAIGRAGWDNWMIYHARQRGWLVIDCTPSVVIVHQNHDYSHLPGGRPHYDQDESQENMSMAGGLAHMYMVLDADCQLVGGRLRQPPITLIRLARRIERWLMPPDGSLRGRRGGLARRFRRLRRKLSGEL